MREPITAKLLVLPLLQSFIGIWAVHVCHRGSRTKNQSNVTAKFYSTADAISKGSSLRNPIEFSNCTQAYVYSVLSSTLHITSYIAQYYMYMHVGWAYVLMIIWDTHVSTHVKSKLHMKVKILTCFGYPNIQKWLLIAPFSASLKNSIKPGESLV